MVTRRLGGHPAPGIPPCAESLTSLSQPQNGSAAAAGIMLLLTIVVCAALGLGVGTLVGLAAPLAIAGGGVGLLLGFAVVYSRFKNI